MASDEEQEAGPSSTSTRSCLARGRASSCTSARRPTRSAARSGRRPSSPMAQQSIDSARAPMLRGEDAREPHPGGKRGSWRTCSSTCGCSTCRCRSGRRPEERVGPRLAEPKISLVTRPTRAQYLAADPAAAARFAPDALHGGDGVRRAVVAPRPLRRLRRSLAPAIQRGDPQASGHRACSCPIEWGQLRRKTCLADRSPSSGVFFQHPAPLC